MLYELVTLTGPLLALKVMAERAASWSHDASGGTLLGSWHTEIGVLGRVILFRTFKNGDSLATERRRTALAPNPFNSDNLVTGLKSETYEGFSFLPDAKPQKFGGVYEIRTYFLKPGGLSPTLRAWEAAIEPAKEYTDHLVTNMVGLDGSTRVTHIWGFQSLEQRADLRTRHYAAGTWPPKGGPEQILKATSTIAFSNANSPLA